MGVQQARQLTRGPVERVDELLADVAPSRQARRYRVAVVAASVAEAVRAAGGSAFDRSLSGWDVAVFVDDEDVHPVRILGGQLARLDDLADVTASAPPDVVIVSAATHADDGRVGAFVEAVLEAGRVPVMFWDSVPSIDGVALELSAAARAFKARALAAAGAMGEAVESVERFRRA